MIEIAIFLVGLGALIMNQEQRKALARAESRIREEIMLEIAEQRIARLEADVELVGWLTRYRESTKSDMHAMQALVDEFEEMLEPFKVADPDGSEN